MVVDGYVRGEDLKSETKKICTLDLYGMDYKLIPYRTEADGCIRYFEITSLQTGAIFNEHLILIEEDVLEQVLNFIKFLRGQLDE